MSLVVRFVDKDMNIREEFLGFVQCDSGTDGDTLSRTVLQKIEDEWGLVMAEARHMMELVQWQGVSEEFDCKCVS